MGHILLMLSVSWI